LKTPNTQGKKQTVQTELPSLRFGAYGSVTAVCKNRGTTGGLFKGCGITTVIRRGGHQEVVYQKLKKGEAVQTRLRKSQEREFLKAAPVLNTIQPKTARFVNEGRCCAGGPGKGSSAGATPRS